MLDGLVVTLIIAGPVKPSPSATLNEPFCPVFPTSHDASACGAPSTMRQTRTFACLTTPFDAVPLTVVGRTTIDAVPPSPPPPQADKTMSIETESPAPSVSTFAGGSAASGEFRPTVSDQ